MTSHVLEITGMTCTSCADHVEKALLGVPGVQMAEGVVPPRHGPRECRKVARCRSACSRRADGRLRRRTENQHAARSP